MQQQKANMSSLEHQTSRKSGLTLKLCHNVRFAISHAERTDLCGPRYLLPKEYQKENVIILGKGEEEEIAQIYNQKFQRMSRQAKAAKGSPFMEGVAVAAEYDGSPDYEQKQTELALKFKERFEEETKCKIRHISLHMDEGYIDDDGKVHLNTHFHFLIDKMFDDGKMWKPGPQGLAKVQTMVAEELELTRGTTFEQRGKKPARKHIPHAQYKIIREEERARIKELEKKHDLEKSQLLAQIKNHELEKSEIIKSLESKHQLDKKGREEFLNKYYNDEWKKAADKIKSDFDSLKSKHELEKSEIIKSLEEKHGLEKGALQKSVNDLKNEVKELSTKEKYNLIRGFLIGSKKAQPKDYTLLANLKNNKAFVESKYSLIDLGAIDVDDLLFEIRGGDPRQVNERIGVRGELNRDERNPSPNNFAGDGSEHLKPDAVIQPLRRWTVNDQDLFLLPERDPKRGSLAFKDLGERINVRLSDDAQVVRAALIVAAKKWPDGITISGTDDFVKLAESLAREMNITVLNPTAKPLMLQAQREALEAQKKDDDFGLGR